MLLGNIEAIESVEQREAVALRQQCGSRSCRPAPPIPAPPPRPRSLRDGTLEVAAGEHVGLGALHVNLEEVDLADALRLAQGGERYDWQSQAAIADTEAWAF